MDKFLEDTARFSFDHKKYKGETITSNCNLKSYIACRFEDMVFIGTDFTGAAFKECSFLNCQFVRCTLGRVHFSAVEFERSVAKDCSFRASIFARCHILKSLIVNCDFSYAAATNSLLHKMKITGTNFYGAELRLLELDECLLASDCCNIRMACPEEGSFIGYKTTDNCLLKLKILENAKRSSATSRKCRCSAALVLSIENIETHEVCDRTHSSYDHNFIYEVGKIAAVEDFDEDKWKECAPGIHFFLTKEEALQYRKERLGSNRLQADWLQKSFLKKGDEV